MPDLRELDKFGQSIWLDFIRRSFLTSGNLKALIDRGVKGVTSNPAIFEKAIAGSTDYDDDIKRLIQQDQSVHAIYESLAY
ncbi:MAG: transaldolase family protein, partial [Desulfobacterales bacterium]